jgi:hypothetical protein
MGQGGSPARAAAARIVYRTGPGKHLLCAQPPATTTRGPTLPQKTHRLDSWCQVTYSPPMARQPVQVPERR